MAGRKNKALNAKLVSMARILEGIAVAGMRKTWKTIVLPAYMPMAKKYGRADASQVESDLDRISISDELAGAVRVTFNKTGNAALKTSRRRKKILGIPEKGHPSPVVADIIKAREDGVKLVENAHRLYAADVREIFTDPNNYGKSVAELEDMLLDRGNVWQSRAELIARDQTLKLNGKIAESEQRSAGVTQYIWSTSKDERVRDEHKELEGTTQEWIAPPEPGHPGQDFQCRCVALPVIPEDE